MWEPLSLGLGLGRVGAMGGRDFERPTLNVERPIEDGGILDCGLNAAVTRRSGRGTKPDK
jgi:hypothetical protein